MGNSCNAGTDRDRIIITTFIKNGSILYTKKLKTDRNILVCKVKSRGSVVIQ